MNITRLPDDFRWPGGRRIAVIFNIAYEAWSDGQAPGIGPMGNVLKPGFFDTNAHSWASFGAIRGIERLLNIADRQGVRTSVMTNGVLAERYPASVAAIEARGHEIVAHSWGMDVIPVYFDEAGERANIERTQSALNKVIKQPSRGWISPRGTGSLATPKLLAEAGFKHCGDVNDDDAPYLMTIDGKRLVAIPLTMDVNDLPWCVRYGNAPRGLIDVFDDSVRAMAERESRPLTIDVTAHTHVFGRPAGAWVYETIIEHAKARSDLWIATREEIADYLLAQI